MRASPSLDDSVRDAGAALAARDVPRPDVLFLLATGSAAWVELLADASEVSLALVDVPAPWHSERLIIGGLGSLSVWALDDVGGEPCAEGDAPPWSSAFPVWLARDAGARLCVHTSAGGTTYDEHGRAPEARAFAVLRDHIDLSGRSPLLGLGESRLGPLFPDQSRVLHSGLRAAALARAHELGLDASECVAACLPGPALETPAERRMLARLGADVSVQSLAPALVACAHAGMACLALVAVTDRGGPADVARLLEHALAAAPLLDRWLLALAPELAKVLRELRAAEETHGVAGGTS